MSRRVSDRPTVICTVTPQGLVPTTSYDAEMINRYKIGSTVEVMVHQPRNMKQSRLFWATIGKVVDNQDEFPTSEALAKALKIRLRYVDSFKLLGGGLHVEPKSMRDMEEDEFSRFMDQSWLVISTEVIPGLDIDALVREGRLLVNDLEIAR